MKAVLNSKELQKKSESSTFGTGEGWNARGRSEKKDNNKKWRPISRSKSKQPNKDTRKCYKCKKEEHIRKFCPEMTHRKDDSTQSEKGDASISSDGYKSADVLVAFHLNAGGEWVLDSGCSLHMSPKRDWFQDFKEF